MLLLLLLLFSFPFHLFWKYFRSNDYYGVVAEECELTLVGEFMSTRPQTEKICSEFDENVTIRSRVKIGVHNFHCVFNFPNEDDFKNIWKMRSIEIKGQSDVAREMHSGFQTRWGLSYSPCLGAFAVTTIHCHAGNYVKQIVGPIGTPLTMDIAQTIKQDQVWTK